MITVTQGNTHSGNRLRATELTLSGPQGYRGLSLEIEAATSGWVTEEKSLDQKPLATGEWDPYGRSPQRQDSVKIAVPLRPQRLRVYPGEYKPDPVYQQGGVLPAIQTAGCAPDARENENCPQRQSIQEFLKSLCRMFL
ncbi:hypothetical protein J6590_077491 [Homalodisca vitripennis]|nr:hypothetical protein J6590_077491 [Homalodisca vitripennis]